MALRGLLEGEAMSDVVKEAQEFAAKWRSSWSEGEAGDLTRAVNYISALVAELRRVKGQLAKANWLNMCYRIGRLRGEKKMDWTDDQWADHAAGGKGE